MPGRRDADVASIVHGEFGGVLATYLLGIEMSL